MLCSSQLTGSIPLELVEIPALRKMDWSENILALLNYTGYPYFETKSGDTSAKDNFIEYLNSTGEYVNGVVSGRRLTASAVIVPIGTDNDVVMTGSAYIDQENVPIDVTFQPDMPLGITFDYDEMHSRTVIKCFNVLLSSRRAGEMGPSEGKGVLKPGFHLVAVNEASTEGFTFEETLAKLQSSSRGAGPLTLSFVEPFQVTENQQVDSVMQVEGGNEGRLDSELPVQALEVPVAVPDDDAIVEVGKIEEVSQTIRHCLPFLPHLVRS